MNKPSSSQPNCATRIVEKYLLFFSVRYVIAVLLAIALMLSVSGCLREETNTILVSDPLSIKFLSLRQGNNSTYITGVAENGGKNSIVNLTVDAIGYNENYSVVLKRGYADANTGLEPIIAPGEKCPFMIKMFDTVIKNQTGSPKSTSASAVIKNATKSTNPTTAAPTLKNGTRTATTRVTSNSSQSLLPISYYKLRPTYQESSERPYSLLVINSKAIDGTKNLVIAGEIYNNGTQKINHSTVAIAFYKTNGTVLGVFSSYVRGDISPTKTAPFQIIITKNDFSINTREIGATELFAYTSTT